MTSIGPSGSGTHVRAIDAAQPEVIDTATANLARRFGSATRVRRQLGLGRRDHLVERGAARGVGTVRPGRVFTLAGALVRRHERDGGCGTRSGRPMLTGRRVSRDSGSARGLPLAPVSCGVAGPWTAVPTTRPTRRSAWPVPPHYVYRRQWFDQHVEVWLGQATESRGCACLRAGQAGAGAAGRAVSGAGPSIAGLRSTRPAARPSGRCGVARRGRRPVLQPSSDHRRAVRSCARRPQHVWRQTHRRSKTHRFQGTRRT